MQQRHLKEFSMARTNQITASWADMRTCWFLVMISLAESMPQNFTQCLVFMYAISRFSKIQTTRVNSGNHKWLVPYQIESLSLTTMLFQTCIYKYLPIFTWCLHFLNQILIQLCRRNHPTSAQVWNVCVLP